jgi:hypothetical protein
MVSSFPERRTDMPKLSKETAPNAADLGPMSTRSGELAGYTVEFTTFHEDADGAPVFRGLPDDRCQSPHWGYVVSGKLTFRYADRDEVYEGGDAYYAPPGHIPVISAGSEIIEFSPTEEYGRTMAVLERNLAAMRES